MVPPDTVSEGGGAPSPGPEGGEDLPAHGSDLPARAGGGAAPITPEQFELVIRRASDLQFRSSHAVETELDTDEVVRIGEEVGLEPRYVRQALAEVQASALVPAAPEDSGFARRLAGPALVRASRVVPGGREDVERNLERYLTDRELLKAVRTLPGRSLWEPAGGLLKGMRRAMDVSGHGYVLAKAKRLQVAIEPLESGWSLVTLTADMSNVRMESTAGWMTGLGLGSLVPAVGLVVATGGAALAVGGGVVLFASGLGLGATAARTDVRKKRQQMELALQGLLDRIERGETLVVETEPWHQRLLK